MKYFSAGIIVVMFLAAGFLSQRYTEFFSIFLVGHQFTGMVLYFFVTILAVVIAPLSSIPLLPIMATIWGVFWTVILSVAGWFVGSAIAFWIARRFGAPIVRRLASVENKKDLLKNVSEKNLFWYLLLLRVTIPVDILSYALGLFTDISWKLFISTTFIGIIPTVILLAKVGTFPIKYQIMMVILAVFLLLMGWWIVGGKKLKYSD